MDKSLHIVLGMTIAYAASLLGLILAWVSYNRRRKAKDKGEDDAGGNDN